MLLVPAAPTPRFRDDLLIAVCGAVLFLTQIIMVREIGSTFFSTELVTLFAVITVLIGPSIAYVAAERVSERGLIVWGIATVVILLVLPVGIRVFVTLLMHWNLSLVAFGATFLLGGLSTSAWFAIFLPRFVSRGQSFQRLYTLELSGALLALSAVAFSPSWQALIFLYFFLTCLGLHLALNRIIWSWGALTIGLVIGLLYPSVDAWAMEFYLRVAWGLEQPKSIATAYSPYQRIDVVQDGDQRLLFLDGIPYYDAEDLHRFNFYIAELPGRFITRKGNALVIGSGSLSSTAYLVRQGFKVTTVDIDRQVADFGLTWFRDLHRLDPGDFTLVIDDARRFVANHPNERYDLIVLDLPAPFHVQVSLLYAPRFLSELKSRLNLGGLLAMNTTGYEIDGPVAGPIISGACSVFEETIGVTGDSLGLTVLYCSSKLPMSTSDIRDHLQKDEKIGFLLYNTATLRLSTRNTPPHTDQHLSALLQTARLRFAGNR